MPFPTIPLSRVTRFARLGAVVLVALGCDDVAGPRDELTGTWALVSVDGQAPPVLLLEGSIARLTLVADTIRFGTRGVAMRTQVTRHESVDAREPSRGVESESYVAPYTLQDGHVVIGEVVTCGPAALCVGHDAGRVDGAVLVMTRQRTFAHTAPWRFVRVR